MRIEILTEDKSGAVVVERLVKRMLTAISVPAEIAVRPHRGCGSFPKNPDEKPPKFSSALLDLLPAKCRAYNKTLSVSEDVLIVIMDSDDNDPLELKRKLRDCCKKYAPSIKSVIGLCTEEIEAWLLGDKEAVLMAYPEANELCFEEYQQDSVCGTWEMLCKIVCPETYNDIIDIGYPAIGHYKARWADEISKNMKPELNCSPSFIAFKKAFEEAVSKPVPARGHHVRSF